MTTTRKKIGWIFLEFNENLLKSKYVSLLRSTAASSPGLDPDPVE